jgi:hypothetical protein
MEIEIGGRMRKIRKQEAREIENGNQEVLDSLKARFDYEDKLRAKNEANLKAYWQKINEGRKRTGLEPVGPKEYQQEESPEDVMKGLGEFGKAIVKISGASGSEAAKACTQEFQNTFASTPMTMEGLGEFGKTLVKISGASGSEAAKTYLQEFQNTLASAPMTIKELGKSDKTLQKISGSGSKAAKAYLQEFQNTLASAPVAIPAVQPPNIDTASMLQNVQTQLPQISQTMSRSFSGLQLTLPSSAMDGFFNEIIERVNSGTATVSLALSTAFSTIDLTPAGVTVAESFTKGLLSGIESSGFVSKLYEKIMAKFSNDIMAAGGEK